MKMYIHVIALSFSFNFLISFLRSQQESQKERDYELALRLAAVINNFLFSLYFLCKCDLVCIH